MPKHVAVQEPFPQIVKDANDVLGLAGLNQCCVSKITKITVWINFKKVMPVQMNAMRKARVIDEADPRGFAAFKVMKRCIRQTRLSVKRPDARPRHHAAAHRAALHG